MLKTFAALLTGIVIAEVAGAVYVLAVNPGGSQQEIKKKMNEAMENFGKPDYEGVTITWNLAQYNLKCCGVDNSGDWTTTGHTGSSQLIIPDSCYKDADCN